MPYIVTVHKVTSTQVPAGSGASFKCFEQEFADEQFNMSKFVLSLNKPQRKRGPKPKAEKASAS